jgi:hypothetical protein
MATTKRKIEVDDATAAALERRAAEQGLSVAELLADLAQGASDPVTLRDDDIAELDRRWETAREDGLVAHADVARWLQTWGTQAFKPWRDR